MTPARSLRERIARKGAVQVMAAHSPLSARLAEEAGFDGVWASGFELSALFGLPDLSLISMSQHLEMTRAIAEQTSLPVVADIDTGFGNAINVMHAVERYERAGVAALVMEDKHFPKATSLAEDVRQDLVPIAEFQGKIEAALNARSDSDLLIIGRVEALIAGLGEREALRRAHAYADAGADMILVHSKQRNAAEIESFVRAWHGGTPLVVVPTTFPELTVERARALGRIAMLIYGNHAIRAAAAAMRRVFARIVQDGGSQNVDADLAPVEEIFRLQRMDLVRQREARFLR